MLTHTVSIRVQDITLSIQNGSGIPLATLLSSVF